MFRDPFGNTLYLFMADSFGHALLSRSMPWQMSLLEGTGPDTVVIELVERNLDYLSDRPTIFPAPMWMLTGQSLARNYAPTAWAGMRAANWPATGLRCIPAARGDTETVQDVI